MHLVTSDPVAPIDLPAWCHMTGHEYVGRVRGRDVPTFAVRVAATGVRTMPGRPWHVEGGSVRA